MKQEKGITLIALSITIIIIITLSGVGIVAGVDSINKTKVMQFETELKIIHARVNELVEEMDTEELNQLGIQASSKVSAQKASEIGATDLENFRYFDKTGLESINVTGIDREIIINFSTREVIDLDGIDEDGTMVYRSKEWKNNSYSDKNTKAPTFDLSKKVYGLNATITVENIQLFGNVAKATISYCLLKEDGTEGTWYQISEKEIPVSVMGTYKVRLTDSAGNISDKEVEIALTNKPKLVNGMRPIVFDEDGNILEIGENSGEWYDYSPDAKKWANAVTEDGSIWVWIPRYMYSIPEQNFNKSEQGIVNIKFLKGTTSISTDNTNERILNAIGAGNWNVHPAFQNESKINYKNRWLG